MAWTTRRSRVAREPWEGGEILPPGSALPGGYEMLLANAAAGQPALAAPAKILDPLNVGEWPVHLSPAVQQWVPGGVMLVGNPLAQTGYVAGHRSNGDHRPSASIGRFAIGLDAPGYQHPTHGTIAAGAPGEPDVETPWPSGQSSAPE